MKRNETDVLWYDTPAENFQEALPLGNGSLGAMVYGGTDTEHYSLNYDQLWTGYPKFMTGNDNREALKAAREAALARDYNRAHDIISENFPTCSADSYQPMGDLYLCFDHGKGDGLCRSLDFRDALSDVTYTANGARYHREAFASFPDRVICTRVTADAPFSFTAKMDSKLRHTVTAENGCLILSGECMGSSEFNRKMHPDLCPAEYMEEDEKRGILFAAVLTVVTDGTVTEKDGTLRVEHATVADLFLTAESSFNGWNRQPYLDGKPYLEPAMKTLRAAAAKGFDTVKRDHLADYRPFYARVSLDLGEAGRGDLPTDRRLQAHEAGESDPGLYTLLFNFGRYLTIAGSRPGSQPTNLQGIWNELVLPPWHSNYTTNINLEMNYYPTLLCNLREMTEPLTKMVQELAEAGRPVAEHMYGARGFVVHHNTDLWRECVPADGSARWAYFPNAGGWLCHHLFDYYEYTLDEDYLRDTAYPLMTAAAEFYLDMLTRDKDGYLVVSPSTSPENVFRYDGKDCAVSMTSTMTMAIAKELFGNVVRAAKILDDNSKTAKDCEAALPEMLPFRTGARGDLLEYYEDHEWIEQTHRHISHLYALHPARLINPEDTPELMDACRKTLEYRGDAGTGWSLGWKINFWARMRDGDHALKLIDLQLHPVSSLGVDYSFAGGTYPNLFDAHPPFQIDGNFGATSGIAEMLLSSGDGRVTLLPALPSSWKKGSVKGLCARGNVSLSIVWEDGTLKSYRVTGDPKGLRFFFRGVDVTDKMERD